MRQLIEQHGEVGRLYMAPELSSLRAKRKKLKGNTGKNFTEGWVEFEDKRVAKSVRSFFRSLSQWAPVSDDAIMHDAAFKVSVLSADIEPVKNS